MDTGSFNANGSGGGSAIADAMSRLGIGQGSVMNQNPTSPTSVAPAQVPAASGQPPMPQQQPQGEQPDPRVDPHTDTIIKALTQKMNSISKIQEAQAGLLGGGK